MLTDTLTLHAEWIDGLWHLDSLVTGEFDWAGELTIVDSCGVTTAAQIYVLNTLAPRGARMKRHATTSERLALTTDHACFLATNVRRVRD